VSLTLARWRQAAFAGQAAKVVQPSLPPVQAPVLGIWSDADHYLDGERMRQSAAWVAGPWRYAEIAGASHWVPRDAPAQLNDLLLDWLR